MGSLGKSNVGDDFVLGLTAVCLWVWDNKVALAIGFVLGAYLRSQL